MMISIHVHVCAFTTMLGRNCRIPWSASCLEDVAPRPLDYYAPPGKPNVRTDVKQELQQRFRDYAVSYGHNTMTWQLGHHLHAQYRTVTDAEALAAAKTFLESMEYVGFFGDMFRDFPRLKSAVFPHAQGSWMWVAAYELGALFGLPRMRTLKYFSHLSPEEKTAVAAANALDMELYEWAKQRFGKEHIVMHDSYATFALAFSPALLVGTAAIIILFQWVCSGCGCGRGSERGKGSTEANGGGRDLPTGGEDGTPFRSMGITSTAKWSFTAKSTAWILFPICIVLYIVMQFELVS